MDSLNIKFGKYTLVDKIGDGGMAEVYRARVAGVGGFEKIVALKKIHPSLSSNVRFQKNFVNEARICGQLHHHNVVEVYEFDRVGDALYLAMEFIDGANLEDLLNVHNKRRECPLPANVIVSLMLQVLEGLSYAHDAKSLDGKALNVIHRDLKPSNILIDRSGVVKIVDFGVAKADMKRYVTQEMTAKGTASYMAPEQVLGEKNLTHLVDIFAAGSILYELITSHRLFDGDHVFAILKAVATTDADDIVARLPEHGAIFGPVLRRMLERDPDKRAQDADELLKAFNALDVGEVGPRTLERFLRDLEDEIEESQATIIDTSGMSAVTGAADHDHDPLYQTGPTRVAFMPQPKSSKTSLSANTLAGGFDIPDEEEIEDDSPTRTTTGPTRVTPNIIGPTGRAAAPLAPPSSEATATAKVDLAKSTAQITTQQPPPDDEPSSTYPSSHPSDPQLTVPGTPQYVDLDAGHVEPHPQQSFDDSGTAGSGLTLGVPPESNKTGLSTALRVAVVAVVLVVVGMAIFMGKPEEHQLNVDFKSNLDSTLRSATDAASAEAGVEVFMDGNLLCKTPCTQLFNITGDRAEMVVTAKKGGYTPISTTVQLDAALKGGAPKPVRFFMKPVPQVVSVASNPAGARIIVNGTDSGKVTPANIELPSVGTHVFKLEMEGRSPREHIVEIGTSPQPLNLELGEELNQRGRKR